MTPHARQTDPQVNQILWPTTINRQTHTFRLSQKHFRNVSLL